MAVSDFNAPNLAPAYGNITEQLQARAGLMRNKPNILNAASGTINKLEQQNYEVGKLYLQHAFDTELKRQDGEFQKRGEVIVDDEIIKDAQDGLGVDISKWKGKSVKINDFYDNIEKQYDVFGDAKIGPQIKQVMEDQGLTAQQKAAKIASLSAGSTIHGAKSVSEQATKDYFNTGKSGAGREHVIEGTDGLPHVLNDDGLREYVANPDGFDFSKWPVKAYAPQTRTNPRTKEVIQVTSSGKTRGITGPEAAPVDENGKKLPRNDYNQLDTRERSVVEKEAVAVTKDKVVQENREIRSKLGYLRQEIEANIPQGIGVVQSQIARVLATEKGALAEGDVGRASGNQSYEGRFARYAKKAADGKMTDDDVKGFLQLIDLIDRGTAKVYDNAINGHVKQLQVDLKDVDPAVIRKRIDPGAIGSVKTASDFWAKKKGKK